MDVQAQIDELKARLDALESSTTIPLPVDQAFRDRFKIPSNELPDELASAPLAAVTSPSGGATIDSQARSAIDTIITRLESLGLIIPN